MNRSAHAYDIVHTQHLTEHQRHALERLRYLTAHPQEATLAELDCLGELLPGVLAQYRLRRLRNPSSHEPNATR